MLSRFRRNEAARKTVAVSDGPIADVDGHFYYTARTARTTLVAISTDSLRLICLGDERQRNESSVSFDALMSEKRSPLAFGATRERWVAASALALGDSFAIVLSELLSTRRAIALVTSGCSIVRLSELPSGIVPAAVSDKSAQLVTSNVFVRNEFAVFDWRWGRDVATNLFPHGGRV
jgi:hypothetical protein